MPFVADLVAANELRGHVEARFQMATFVPRHPAGSRASASASSIRPFTSAPSPSLDDPPPAAQVAPRSVQRGCRRPWQTKQRSKVRGAVWCQPMDPLARPFPGCSTGAEPAVHALSVVGRGARACIRPLDPGRDGRAPVHHHLLLLSSCCRARVGLPRAGCRQPAPVGRAVLACRALPCVPVPQVSVASSNSEVTAVDSPPPVRRCG